MASGGVCEALFYYLSNQQLRMFTLNLLVISLYFSLLKDNMASPRGFDLIPQLRIASEVSIYQEHTTG